jgi:hypothetical protein
MIGTLPIPLDGETFESLVTRLARRLSEHDRIRNARNMAGDGAEGRFSPLRLVSNLANPEWLQLSQILESHTPLRILRPFMNPADCDRIIRQLSRAEKPYTVSRTQADRQRICPECRTTELEGIAEVGWRVLHQFRWMWRCQTHHCPLWQSPASNELKVTAKPVETGCRNRADFETLKALERDTKWLMGKQVPALGRLRWREFHRASLTERFGIQPPYTSRELFHLAHGISPRARAWLQLPMVSHLDNWLLTAVRRQHGATNPLLHLATLRVCGKRVAEAVRQLTAAEPTSAHVTPAHLPL